MTELAKKQLRGEKTKKKILEVALKLFAEKGFNKVTVDAIVKKSNTSKGSFYQHFRTKSDVFLERFKEVDTFYLEVYKSFPADMDPIEKLSIFTQKLMRFLEDEMGKDLMKVIYSAALESNEHTYFLESNRYLFKILRRLLEEAIEKDRIHSAFSIEDMLTMVTQAYMGAIYHWGLQTTDRSLESLSMPLLQALLKGVAK
ncbi:transcriptional regulator, TetR family [Psychrobacillus sp. OK028]|uniref:TetR/AcrR family transcriptional regulator n=1 Tax=Psychrobacillus sp. OK028 TaxID=1884359 RepID=UPI0008900F68|nr:TetR/AcrR family transcriptional regulator [Psychrobacillus sp. OK028]SDM38364.1 transcriptional regulator, TetR family [Psychrobacillus sp. OK028]